MSSKSTTGNRGSSLRATNFFLVLAIILQISEAWIPAATTIASTSIRKTSRISTTTRTFVSKSTTTKLSAIKTDEELLPIVRDGIAEQGHTEAWQDCVQIMLDTEALHLNDDDSGEEQAEVFLAAALEWRGWARVSSALARKYMSPKQPDPVQLQAALTWLTQDGPLAALLRDSNHLVEAIRSSPTAYLVDPAAAYQQALTTAPAPYRNAPDPFHKLLLGDPSALQNNYNCKDGDEGCNSECGTCWVTYGIKQKMTANADDGLW